MGQCEALLQEIVNELKKNNELQTEIKEHLKSLDELIKGVIG